MSRILGRIPVYIVTGFLGTGKSSAINTLLRSRSSRMGLASMEQGHTALKGGDIVTLPLTSQGNLKYTTYLLKAYNEHHDMRELWLEWNGMVPFSVCAELFLKTKLRQYYYIKEVLFVTTPAFCCHMLGKTGDAVVSQLAQADRVLLWDGPGETAVHVAAAVSVLRELRPNIPIHTMSSLKTEKDIQAVCKAPSKQSWSLYTILTVLAAAVYLFFASSTDPAHASFHVTITFWMASLLQSLPFLVLGILCSAALQLYVPPSWLETMLCRSLPKSMACALICAFFFPVCDCAAVPMCKSLLARKVPLPSALLFTLCSPLVNPVVMLSTYYAFFGHPEVMWYRLLFGVGAALCVSLSFLGSRSMPPSMSLGRSLPPSFYMARRRDVVPAGTSGKCMQFLLQTKGEFFRTVPYILVGTLIVSLFQVSSTTIVQWYSMTGNIAMTIEIMMAMAFLLSICSTSDAIIARNLTAVIPLPGVLAFLITGPMIDVKNILLWLSLFPRFFVLRLAVCILLFCFLFSFGAALYLGSVI